MKNVQPKTDNPLSIASKKNDLNTVKPLNPKREELTPAILKTFIGYQNLSDKEAEEKCTSIKSFARLR